MDTLFSRYEHELVLLRSLCKEYAQRYPKVAAQLQMNADACGDPHVERLIQAVALMCARVSARLEDSYPQFTEALLEMVLPHYLRPFPSCAIVRVGDEGASAGGTAEVPRLPRGTSLVAAPVHGVQCGFKTIYDIEPSAVTLADARFEALIRAPASVQLPDGVTSSIRLEFAAATLAQAISAPRRLRLYIDADSSLSATLRDALFMQVAAAYVCSGDSDQWVRLPSVPVETVGFSDTDALIPFSARSHTAYRILSEYFAFPDKFSFIDVDVPASLALLPAGATRFTLHLALTGVRADSNQARLLASLTRETLVQNCTPIVNLFSRPAVPIVHDQRSVGYTLLADSAQPGAFEVYSVDKVHLVRRGGGDHAIEEYRPFYSLRHGDGGAFSDVRYWFMRHDAAMAAASPGHEKTISLVNADGDMLDAKREALSIELTCTNRDLPSLLKLGAPEGDLAVTGTASHQAIRCIRRPTRSLRFANGPDTQWRLISHLVLNHYSLVSDGATGLRELLTLYDVAQSPISRRQIASLTELDVKPATAWIRHPRGPWLAHGLEVRITLDEEAFLGSGLHLFVQILDHVLGMYVHLNSFVELAVLSHHTGRELFRCPPRSGDASLL